MLKIAYTQSGTSHVFSEFSMFYDPKDGKNLHYVMLLVHLKSLYIVKFSGGFAPLPSAPPFPKSLLRP